MLTDTLTKNYFKIMGLMVHSIESLPEENQLSYFIYLLDYGWKEPLSVALKSNFGKMATLASEYKNAVVITRTDEGIHFSDEVLSWHNFNGNDAERNELLPAILLTNRHPSEFRKRSEVSYDEDVIEDNLKLILFPLKKYCDSTESVVTLIQEIFQKIKTNTDLDNFEIVQRRRKNGERNALAESLIITPTNTGTSVSFNQIQNYFE